ELGAGRRRVQGFTTSNSVGDQNVVPTPGCLQPAQDDAFVEREADGIRGHHRGLVSALRDCAIKRQLLTVFQVRSPEAASRKRLAHMVVLQRPRAGPERRCRTKTAVPAPVVESSTALGELP